MQHIYYQIADFLSFPSPLVLATIIRTSGSTPQKEGNSVVFGKDGILSGTIGGGVLEGRVQKLAENIMNTGISGVYNFNLDYDVFHDEDAICGGQATVLTDAAPQNHIPVFNELKDSLEKGEPGVMLTVIKKMAEHRAEIQKFWITEGNATPLPEKYKDKAESAIQKLLSKGTPGDTTNMELYVPGEKEGRILFFEAIFPLPKLVIAGAGHIGKALAAMGKLLDFNVTVIDDRSEFANAKNIPDADLLIVDDIGKAMSGLRKTRDTFIVIVTRGHKDDEKALKTCIGAEVAYTGMIGSHHKVALMRNNFIQNGWATADQWAAIHTPIGLDIKSKTVWEIVVSIAAQLILVRNSGK
jgi:xanthine dehydrogenase accessory factor